MDKKSLSERDICTKFITPAIVQAAKTETELMLELFPGPAEIGSLLTCHGGLNTN